MQEERDRMVVVVNLNLEFQMMHVCLLGLWLLNN